MNATIKVYESDGDDGYTAGTYGVIVSLGDCCSSDGGFPSRELARERGEEIAAAAVKAGQKA